MKIPREAISCAEFQMLLDCYRAGDESALKPLVLGMLKRIDWAARGWDQVVDREDLVQEGVCALLEYLPQVRTDKRSAPISYLMLRIRSKMRDYIMRSCPVTEPRHRPGRAGKIVVIARGKSLGAPGEMEKVIYGVAA